MCGIFGYIGESPCLDIVTEGLRKLEYRGYDSVGVMVYDDAIQVAKIIGTVADLLPSTQKLSKSATVGIGHTRWASHGKPTTANAHPHFTPNIAMVHNGIIDNYEQLRSTLKDVEFKSETDTEVVLHLLDRELQNDVEPFFAFRKVCQQLKGMYALAIFCKKDPDKLFLIRNGLSLAVAVSSQAKLFSSDPIALGEHSNEFMFLNNNEIAVMSEKELALYDLQGNSCQQPPVHQLQISSEEDGKGGYDHYMLKEINQQGHVLANTVHRLFDFVNYCPRHDLLGVDRIDIERVKRIKVVGCGTSYHASMLAPYFVDSYLQVEAQPEVAHELRYRQSLLDEHTLMIALSQSGETADTITCIEHAKKHACQTLVICNNPYSTLCKLCDVTIDLKCGREVSVASTKTFTATVLTFFLLITAFRQRKGYSLPPEIYNLRKLPLLVDYVLANINQVEEVAKCYQNAEHFLFLGRGTSYPVAMEAALKLKEVSYLHAAGYAGGELKHGTLALVDKSIPSLIIAPQDEYLAKTVSCAREVKAREGQVIILGAVDNPILRSVSDHLIPCPTINQPILQAIVSTVSLQLFAYFIALARGTNIDQPRHLAKSVTVE